MSQIRAFLAIDIDDDLKPEINNVVREFKKTDANIKYVDLMNMHLTLKFFGDIDVDGIGLIKNAIDKSVSDFNPFKINITGCGAFPNNNKIRVLWLGLDNDDLIKELHFKLDEEFKRIGFEKDKKFSTHLTIGRMKSAYNKDKVKKTLKEYEDIEIGEMEVSKIVLKKSTLTPKGPIYEDLEVFEL